jgi:hypothetical protein
MKQNYWTYNKPLSMTGFGGGATSLLYSSSAATVIPSFTAAEHFYIQGSSGDTDTTWNMHTYSANENWSDIPVVTTSGKRLFVIVASWRDTSSNEDTWTEQFNDPLGDSLNYNLELKYNSATTTLTYRNVFAISQYNSTSIWTAIADGAAASTDDYSIRFYVNDSNGHGNFAFSGIVIDNVNTIEYFNTASLDYQDSTMNVTSALNLAPNNTTSASKVLRIAAGNASNISSDVIDYNKGGSEPTYTKIGEGDNGTNERHYHSYHFGDHGTQVNMTGTFGDSSTNASDGISGLGAIIGLS